MTTPPALLAGFATRDVTPAPGVPMEGLGQQGGAESVHDPLLVRALALQQGTRNTLIVAIDLLFFERGQADRLKQALHRALGLAPDDVLLNTSHTHAGPRITTWSYGGTPDPAYVDRVEEALVDAAIEASCRLEPVTVRAGTGQTDLPVCRRHPNADNRAQWAPCRSEEVCRAVPFAQLLTATGETLSLLVSASCHPSMIYSLDLSAEYPGAAVRQLNERLGTRGTLFLQGAAGDTKPRQIAVDESSWRAGTWEEMEAAGRDVADAVASALPGARPVTPDLRTWLTETAFDLEPAPSRETLEAVRDDPEERDQRRRWAEEMLGLLDGGGELPRTAPVLVHAVQLGPECGLLALEAEVVGRLGNRLLEQFPGKVLFPLGYTNGCKLYLPDDGMLPQGGYEVDSYWEYHVPARLAAGIDRRLADTGEDLRRQGFLADPAPSP